MKNKILRVTAVFLATLSVVFSLSACDGESKKSLTPTDKFFVNDFAEVMTETDINTVYTKGVALQEQTSAQAVIVTVDDLDDEPIEDYALNIGREWGIGDDDKDNGIVVLFSENDREIYIAVGYGLEGALPDSKTGRIIDTYGIPYFSKDDFSTGLVSVYNSIVNEIYLEYGITPDENYTAIATLPQNDDYGDETSIGQIAISWLVLIVLVVLYILIFGRRGGMFIFGSPRHFTGGFNNHHHGDFGGFGGSSGGFGGFKGGGGSFGGGGAGRKF